MAMNLGIYSVARDKAALIAPSCSDRELVRRIEAAQQIQAQAIEDGDEWTAATAAFDEFESELERRHPMPDGITDDDDRCLCGVHRSEHQLCGCGEWERAR